MRILRVVRSAILSCGCLVGRYETYAGGTVSFIDWRDQRCPHASHWAGRVLKDDSGSGVLESDRALVEKATGVTAAP
jgi:hypothetical protein